MNEKLNPRLFEFGDRVQCEKGAGRIFGYEEGRDLGRHRPRYNGWVYHVVLESNDTIVLVHEDKLLK